MRFFRKLKKFFRSFIQRVKVGASRTSKKVADNVKMVVKKVAAFGKKIVERVAKRSKNLKTKVTGFFKKAGRWFKVRFKRVKTFIDKVMLEVARVFVPFHTMFYSAAVAIFNAVLIGAVLVTSNFAALPFVVFANIGLRAIHEKLVKKAEAALTAEIKAYDDVIMADEKLLKKALLDPEFKEMFDTYSDFINNNSTILDYSKCPKFLKFLKSNTSSVVMQGGVILSVIAPSVVGGCILKLPYETMQFVLPSSFFTAMTVLTIVPSFAIGMAAYRSSRKLHYIAKAMAEYIDTLEKNQEEEERQRKARWEARQEEERQRKYGKKGGKK